MQGMLGADPASLTALASTMGETAVQLGDVRMDADRVASRVVEEMQQAFDRAVQEITAGMEAMAGQVGRAEGEAAAAAWTGRNHELFMTSSAEFAGAARRVESDTAQAYAEFTTALRGLADTLLTFQQSVGAHLAVAETSSMSMQQAVQAQLQALETTMNSGFLAG